MIASAENLKAKSVQLGFNLVGLTRAAPSPTLHAYHRWIEAGMYGAMGYMARPDRVLRRQDLSVILPSVQSIIMVGFDYRTSVSNELLHDPSRGRVASYAWGLDYHDVMTPRLDELAQWIGEEAGLTMDYRVYVDTGAILERSHAQQSGMGFIGKNTMLIHPRRGSYFFLGEILTTLEFDVYDEPHRETMCGRCSRCLGACPTDAFPEPYVLDARRCISYHTIENKGWIDLGLRADFGNWIYGCDVCQEVCPFQRFSPLAQETSFEAHDISHIAPKIVDVLALTEEAFKQRYKNSPIYRIKRERFVRNACVSAGNWGDSQTIPYLIQLLYDPSALIRGHAAWALWQIMRWDARRMLTDLYDREDDERVKSEIEILLG